MTSFWQLFLVVADKVWTFLRTHWQLVVLALVVGATYFEVQKFKRSAMNQVMTIEHDKDEEIKNINSIREQERKQHEENLKTLRRELDEVKLQYEQQQQVINAKQKTETKQIVQQSGGNPSILAQQLAEAIGLQVLKVQK